MNVLLTGGTGFVGREVAQELAASGASVRMLVRDPASPSATRVANSCRADLRTGDILDRVSLLAALNGVDAVVHLVGIIGEVGQCTFDNIHTAGTRNLVTAAQIRGVKRFVHMSALGTRPNARSRYHRSKWAAEEAVRQSGLDFTIFRPSLIFGPNDHFVNLFASIARSSPVVPIVGSSTSKFQPVAVEVVAAAFARSLTVPASIGQEYALCGHETFTLPQIVDEVLAACEKRRLKLLIPEPVARFQAAVLEFIYPRLLRKAPPLSRDQLLMLEEGNMGDPAPAEQAFSLNQGSFRAGIGRYLATPQSRKP
jgi:NADH dehydrogenase